MIILKDMLLYIICLCSSTDRALVFETKGCTFESYYRWQKSHSLDN